MARAVMTGTELHAVAYSVDRGRIRRTRPIE